jgi:hypothetical protein
MLRTHLKKSLAQCSRSKAIKQQVAFQIAAQQGGA